MTPNENVITVLKRLRDDVQTKLAANVSKRQEVERVLPTHRQNLDRASHEHEEAERAAASALQEHNDFEEFLNMRSGADSVLRRAQLDSLRREKEEAATRARERHEVARKAREQVTIDERCLQRLEQERKDLIAELDRTNKDIDNLA